MFERVRSPTTLVACRPAVPGSSIAELSTSYCPALSSDGHTVSSRPEIGPTRPYGWHRVSDELWHCWSLSVANTSLAGVIGSTPRVGRRGVGSASDTIRSPPGHRLVASVAAWIGLAIHRKRARKEQRLHHVMARWTRDELDPAASAGRDMTQAQRNELLYRPYFDAGDAVAFELHGPSGPTEYAGSGGSEEYSGDDRVRAGGLEELTTA